MGLNNGGNIALEVCRRRNVPINRLILIDPPLFMDKGFIDEIEEFIHALGAESSEAFIAALVQNLFIQTTETNRKIAFDAFSKADNASLQDMFRSIIEWNTACQTAIQSVNCPTLAIVTDEHHCTAQAFQENAPDFENWKSCSLKMLGNAGSSRAAESHGRALFSSLLDTVRQGKSN